MNDSIIRGIAKSEAEKLIAIGSISYTGQTSDATPTIITTIPIDDYTGGLFEVSVIGLKDDGSAVYGGKKIVLYRKETTLTLGTITDILASANFTIINSSDDIAVQVTGVAATVIDWTVKVENIFTEATNVP